MLFLFEHNEVTQTQSMYRVKWEISFSGNGTVLCNVGGVCASFFNV